MITRPRQTTSRNTGSNLECIRTGVTPLNCHGNAWPPGITKNEQRRIRLHDCRESHLFEKYDNIITEQECRGFIDTVGSDTPPTGQVHYIPHRPVKKDSATTSIRIVYDSSSRKSPSLPSLNDCLESTQPILIDLTSILVRFSIHSYASTTDTEKAFLHTGLDEKDKDSTRFLCSSDIRYQHSPLSTYRFKSVLFGATWSPFILSVTSTCQQ